MLFAQWDAIDSKFTDINAISALCRVDRYYLLVRVCRRLDMLHPWIYARCREVERAPNGYLDLWSREHYKDLADDTPMLTNNRGWTTHGNLTAGDEVFAPNGNIVKVLAVTPQYVDSECYKVTFGDGAQLVAGAGHVWRLRKKIKHRVVNSTARRLEFIEYTATTLDLKNIKRCDVGVNEALQYKVQQFPIHPYLLGVWLGDGHSADGRVTCEDDEVFERIESLGYRVSKRLGISQTVYGIRPLLRSLEVLHSKHIPAQYLESSEYQRMELLRGLMDTDGHCNTRGTATFTNANERLANQVYDLAVSLGLRPRIRKYSFKSEALKAVKGRYAYYQVSFQAHKDRNPFYLKRKASRSIDAYLHRDTRLVSKIERIASVPTRCIQVAGGMYLAGRALVPTHNSTIITFGGAIQRIIQDPEITIGIFSHVNAIAADFLRQIKNELESNEVLKRAFPDILWQDPAKQAQRWSVDGGIVVKRKSNPKEATVEASGIVDGQPIGKHYRLRIYDDVVTDKSVSTPEQAQKTTDSYSLSQSLGQIGGEEWMIGTRYSYADTYEWILKRGALIPRIYAATDDGTKDGKPVFFTGEEWQKRLLKNTDSDIACQYMQDPLSGQAKMFDIGDLMAYEIRPSILNIYIMCDPARSKKKGSANTAVAVIGVDYALNKYLLDGFDHKMDLDERWQAISRMWLRWHRMPGTQRIKVGYEAFGAQADMDYFLLQQKLPNAPRFEIIELAWPRDGEGSKDDRVQRLVPDVRKHKIHLPYDTDMARLTTNQRKMQQQGYDYRIAQPIRRKDENGNVYDLSERLRNQFLYYPFSGLKDLIDATSRVYDMEPMPPSYGEPNYIEPEYT